MANQTCNPSILTQALGITATGPRTVIVPADPIIWDAETSYEYLTLVASTDFGQAYISKRDVPAGTELTNTEYWIPAASYNAQLAQIQKGMAQFNTDLGGKAPTAHASAETTYGVGSASEYGHVKLSDTATEGNATGGTAVTPDGVKKIISSVKPVCLIIGDSFSNDAQSGTPLWYEYYCDRKGYTPYSTAADGAGYLVGYTFSQQITAATSAVNAADVAEVIIFGGLNDTRSSSYNADSFGSAVGSTIEMAKTSFPNAVVWCVGPQNFPNANTNSWTAAYWLSFQCAYHGAKYSNASFVFNWINGFFGGTTGQNEHPTAEGEMMIASFMLNDGHWSSAAGFFSVAPDTMRKLNIISNDETSYVSTLKSAQYEIINEVLFHAQIAIDPSTIPNTVTTLSVQLPAMENPPFGIKAAAGVPYICGSASQILGNTSVRGYATGSGITFNVNSDYPIKTGSGANQVTFDILLHC